MSPEPIDTLLYPHRMPRMHRLHMLAAIATVACAWFFAPKIYAQNATLLGNTETIPSLTLSLDRDIACFASTDSSCEGMNLERCAAEANLDSEEVQVTASLSQLLTSLTPTPGRIWLTQSADDATSPCAGSDTEIANTGTEWELAVGSTQIETDSLQYSRADLLDAFETAYGNFCAGLETRSIYICVGLDITTALGGSRSYNDVGDIMAWVRIPFDSIPPRRATIIATPGDQSIQIKPGLESTATGSDTLSGFDVRYRPLPSDEEAASQACTLWSDATVVQSTGDGEFAIDGLSNATSYQFCLIAKDAAGNAGEASLVAVATPIDQCDFLECHPGGLEVGYCGAAAGAPWLALLGLMGALRAMLRNRKTGTETRR